MYVCADAHECVATNTSSQAQVLPWGKAKAAHRLRARLPRRFQVEKRVPNKQKAKFLVS